LDGFSWSSWELCVVVLVFFGASKANSESVCYSLLGSKGFD